MIDTSNIKEPLANERRHFHRMRLSTAVRLTDAQGEQVAEARVTDLSGGGVRFESSCKLAVGTQVGFEIQPGRHESFDGAFMALTGKARIVRVDGEQAPFSVAAVFQEVR